MTSLSFKPWARDSAETNSLKEVLGRINLERGHFRDITEASLQEEVAGEGGLELSESEEDDEDEEEAAEQRRDKPSTREEVYRVKHDMIQQIAAAHNEVMTALDFVSLLLSKDDPKAAQSASPGLKSMVPMGTLGMDIWHNMPRDNAREAQDEVVATNVRMDGLQQSANDLLAAAGRLEEDVRKETQYWDQIISITERGWNVCKIPGQQHRLGVTFGFNESAPDFSRRGIAALNPSEEGGIALEHGVGVKPKALQVQIKRSEKVVGTSKLATLPDNGETTLEARIRHARDSLFDEEVLHEMVRESRGQASLGVTTKVDAICFTPQPDDTTEVRFQLVSLDEVDGPAKGAQQQDALAEAIALGARMLLGQARREKLRQRSEAPPPLSDRKEERAVLPILRPIMAFVLHQSALDQVNTYTAKLGSLLEIAGVEHECKAARLRFPALQNVKHAESLVRTFMNTWISRADLKLSAAAPACNLSIALETTLAGGFGTVYVFEDPTDKRTFRLSSIDEVRAVCDAALASALSGLLNAKGGGRWKLDGREALLTRAASEGNKDGSIWITVDSEAGSLSMSSPTKKTAWSGSGDMADLSFEEAWKGMSA